MVMTITRKTLTGYADRIWMYRRGTESTYGQDNVEQSIMLNRVSNLIMENANVTEVQADSSADSSSDDSGN
mgnify:CR=1 FL=1